MTNGLFGLSEDDFWTDPWINGEELFNRYVLDGEYGLYIDAPERVQPKDRPSIPVPFFYSAEQREAYKLDIEKQAKVVAVRLEDRTFFIADAIEPEDNALPLPKVGADSIDPTSESHDIDLQTRLSLLSEPGAYRIVVLLTKQASNVVEVVVEQPRIEHEDPEVIKFIEARRTPPIIPPPPTPSAELIFDSDAEGLPQPVADAPEVPEEEGIGLAVERVILNTEDATAILKGSYKLNILHKYERVPEPPEELEDPGDASLPTPPAEAEDEDDASVPTSPAEAEDADDTSLPTPSAEPEDEDDASLPTLPDYGTPRPSAVLTIHLVILGSVSMGATHIPLHIPVYADLDSESDTTTVEGTFAIDLFKNENLRIVPQTFAIYSFCGEIMAGPVLMATLTEEMLPKPGS